MATLPSGVHVLRRKQSAPPAKKLRSPLHWTTWLWPGWFALTLLVGGLGAERVAIWMFIAQCAVAATFATYLTFRD